MEKLHYAPQVIYDIIYGTVLAVYFAYFFHIITWFENTNYSNGEGEHDHV